MAKNTFVIELANFRPEDSIYVEVHDDLIGHTVQHFISVIIFISIFAFIDLILILQIVSFNIINYIKRSMLCHIFATQPCL